MKRGEYVLTTVYTSHSSTSSRKAIQWFKDEGIPFREIRVTKDGVTRQQLIELLQLSDNGLEDLLKKKIDIEMVNELSLSEAIKLIVKKPDMLRAPIICNGKSILIGFHEEAIRMFIPREYRLFKLIV
ncbi:hypothetical protein A5865_001303 [Enterococcus sp. 12E11_DIV0728]|nr:hypothetical protein A5865_001303 [Enterococcus sp. 12E11_DIV0728]OUZ16396.1 hypothetical protein A5868_001317 [Enterococcus sp. 12F9_DIV0723]